MLSALRQDHQLARPDSLSITSAASHEGFYEYLARQTTVALLSQLQLGFRHRLIWVSVLSHMGLSYRRSVLKATI